MRDTIIAMREAITRNHILLLDAFTALGITRAEVEYEGGGDSGGVEYVRVEPSDKAPTLETHALMIWQADYGIGFSGKNYTLKIDKPLSLKEAMSSFAMDWLEALHPGWEINDGGRGTITIDVAERRCSLSHCAFYTESTTYDYALP